LLEFEAKRRKYHLDYRDSALAWKNQNLDDAVNLDDAYKESLGKLANNQLKVWQTIKEGTVAEQEAFAAMMSVGGGEQTGARSKSSTSRREAVMAYGQKMNKIAIAKASGKDSASLFASNVREAFATAAHKLDVKSGTSRPVYGEPDVFKGFKPKPSKWNMLLGIGQAGFDSLRMYDKLKAPESSESIIGEDYEIDPDVTDPIPWPDPDPDFEPPDIEGPVFDPDNVPPIILDPKEIPEWRMPKGKDKGEKELGSHLNIPFLK